MRVPALLMILFLVFAGQSRAGDIEGQFLLAGQSPLADAPPRVMKGNMAVRDWEVCAKADVPEELLLVDAKSKGIANIVIYLKKAPAGMPAALQAPKVPALKFDQKGCRFEPRILPVQIGQTINCTSKDAVAHNIRTSAFANTNVNVVVTPATPTSVNLTLPENLPIPVRCDFHPWMDAYWVATNHPYVAVTDAEGKFSITGLPDGEHKFTVWHELGGFVPVEENPRTWTVTVKPGKQTIPPIPVPAAHYVKALKELKGK